ncbi:RDD family protein [Martelella mediterranea]|uniref:RDD family protein n=1 Tax=Martelella mediterranea DSM 17316 TaxID=1122214 RepID=A0A1U9Z5G8_9HYPH|nr:RDD family protein [Martelella mediterranea]AQZ52918.1 RDD family protein [Martelella mediterranea DSM 17316]MCD1633009.1 RDD family protein [Martelella mediterranea]
MSLERNMTYSAPPASDAYSGVLSRRVLAFIFDYIVIAILWVPAAVLLFFVGIATLGLAFFLYPVLYFIVAALYFGFSLGGSAQASPGMRAMGLRMLRTDGLRIDFLTALVHLALFWLFNSLLTPLILLVGLFTDRKRLLHDFLIGAVVVREEARY